MTDNKTNTSKDTKPVDFYTLVQRIYNPETDKKTIDAAHVEAIAEDNERDARDWSAFIAQVETQKGIESAHIEAIKEDIRRDLVKRYAYMEGKDPKPLDFYNAEDANKTTVTVELAHREALAEEADKRNTAKAL